MYKLGGVTVVGLAVAVAAASGCGDNARPGGGSSMLGQSSGGASGGGDNDNFDVGQTPVLIAPPNGSTVNSSRPDFAWQIPDQSREVQVQICADAGCATIVTSIVARGGHG